MPVWTTPRFGRRSNRWSSRLFGLARFSKTLRGPTAAHRVAISRAAASGLYEVGPRIGAGGMGDVYRARDTRLNRTVAIKVRADRLADRSDLREQFAREAKAISALNHPRICLLHDVGRDDSIDFLVMEYVEGEPIDVYCDRRGLSTRQRLVVVSHRLRSGSLRAPAPRGPSRSQARQHPGQRRRPAQAPRFRNREAARRQPPPAKLPSPHSRRS